MYRQWPLLLFTLLPACWAYDIVQDYSGSSFFDKWDFYGNWDNLTLGDVWWLGRQDAFAQGLVYVNNAGNAILKVDDVSNVALNQKRNTVRITSQAAYNVGSLWIADIVHLPFGCSVWPAFWTKGTLLWPDGGEIDIIEGINLVSQNQMALHTLPGCYHNTTPPNQMGISDPTKVDCSQPSGCVVSESAPNSFGQGFANAGGGVFGVQFDVAGVFIWFWSRPSIPASIANANATSSINVSDWGAPSASYPASEPCNITQFFTPQNLVIDITLCGIWAGLPAQYLPQCSGAGPTGICYNDNVVGPGGRYSNAYFEIKYVRAYTTGGIAPTPTAAAHALLSQAVTSTIKTTSPAGTVLVPSPLFFPGNTARRGFEVQGWRLTLVGIIVVMTTYLVW